MNKTRIISILTGAMCFGFMNLAMAHFQMIVPSDDMVKQDEPRQLDLDVMFWHPYEGHGMHMKTPVQFGVLSGGKKTSLLDSLIPAKFEDINGDKFDGFKAQYSLRRPGDYIFYTEPAPYWEPSEESFIVHYTKVVVNAFGLEEGWDDEVGLKTEIVPLTRPYGLYTGNVFQGIVKVKGKPAPFTKVEVEYYNKDGKLKPEADPMITQVVKADADGVFTYAMPKAGWWTFAALNEDDKPMIHDGKEYPVEIGALLLVETHDMK
jgi:cobalt/nickel transport protein